MRNNHSNKNNQQQTMNTNPPKKKTQGWFLTHPKSSRFVLPKRTQNNQSGFITPSGPSFHGWGPSFPGSSTTMDDDSLSFLTGWGGDDRISHGEMDGFLWINREVKNGLKRKMFPYGNVFHLLKTGRMTLNGNCHEPNLLVVLVRNH